MLSSKKTKNVERWEQKQRRVARENADKCYDNRLKHYRAARRSHEPLISSCCPHPMTCPHRGWCRYKSEY